MTINDYYQVVDLTPSGKSVRVRKLKKETVHSGEYFQGREMPIKDDFATDNILTKRLGTDYAGRPDIKISSYSKATLWDGVSNFFNHMD